MPVECVSSSVVFATLGVVVDLDLVAVVDGHPFLARLHGNANEHARVIVFISHPEDHVESAILDRAGGPIEQSHAAVRVDQSVLDGHVAGADVFPAGQVFAVENLSPLIRVAGAGVLLSGEREGGQPQREAGPN